VIYHRRAMPSASPVFISYSRKDYYFAESLAFHLLRSGVPAWLDVKDLKPGGDWERDLENALAAASTLLLVVSPDSTESERVRAEWQHALARGCRIIVVHFRKATPAPELQSCEAVDFRGSFGRAFRALMSRLAPDATGQVPALSRAAPGWPVLPPWVTVMALALAIPTLGYFAAASWTLPPDTEYPSLVLLLAPFLALGLAWFFCVAFIRRRMGMTRLGLCLLCLAIVFALPMLRYFFPGLSFLSTDDAASGFSDHWRLTVALAAVPMAGLVILVLLRPEDLLRWTPTGKVWAKYRIGHVASAAFARAEIASQFRQVTTFALAHDPVDAPMAQRLREQLLALGGSEAAAPGEKLTPVLLLSNRTQRAWIDAKTEQVRAEGITVVGTGIDLTHDLDWLWRRQWIDFRGWDIRKGDRALALPQVPDAVTQTRLPGTVARVRHVLCAIAALVFALGGAVSPEEQQQADLSINEWLAYVTFAAAVWWALIAHRLVKRSRTAPLLRRDCLIGCIVTAIVVAPDFYALGSDKLAVSRMVIAAVFLAAAWIWLAWQQASVAFWLPQENLTRAAKRSILGTYRDWSTLIWLAAYAMLWMSILGFVD